MEPDDALGDDEPRSRLLPPDDRLWRHPSEVSSFGLPAEDDRRRRPAPRLWVVALLAAAASAVFTVGLVAAAGGFRQRVRTVPVVERLALPASLSTAPGAADAGVAAIAERLRPAIVQLEVERDGSPGRGSGVMFRSDGHVITNSHVVEGGGQITVTMFDGARADGRVVGVDPATDLAVVKVDEWASVPTAPLGSAANLAVGQGVLALGASPDRGAAAPAAVGTVSAMGRQLERGAAAPLVDMIETDTPVAPAWSGGALVDDRGAVVGIITAVTASGSMPSELGFATPIDLARAVADQLVASGKVVRAWIGVEGADLDRATALSLGVDGGAVVSSVREDGPADRAGLQVEDVIVLVDGLPVASMGALRILLRSHGAGDVVALTVLRNGAHRSLHVTLTERPAGA